MLKKEERALQTFLMHLRNQQSLLIVEKMRLQAELKEIKKESISEFDIIGREMLDGFANECDLEETSNNESLSDEEFTDEEEEEGNLYKI